MITLPDNSQWTQPNSGDKFGSLWGSFNLNLDDLGKITISEKVVNNTTEDDNSDLGLIVSIFKSDPPYTAANNTWYALSHSGKLFNTAEGSEDSDEDFLKTPESVITISNTSGSFVIGETITGGTSGTTAIVVNPESSQLFVIDVSGSFSGGETITGGTSGATGEFVTNTSTDAPTDGLDATDFRGTPIVSSSTDLYKLGTTTWDDEWWTDTLGQASLSSSAPHPLHVPDFINTWLLIGDENNLHVVDNNDNVFNSKLTLPPSHEIIWIRSTSNRIWIGTRHTDNGEGLIAEWNGRSAAPQSLYLIGSNKTFSATAKNDILYSLNRKGQLLAFGGGSFEEAGRLPVANDLIEQQNGSTLSEFNLLLEDAVSQRGMGLIDDKVCILLNASPNSAGTRAVPEMPSGIWQYTTEQGLVHKYGLGNNESGDENDYGQSLVEDVGALEPTYETTRFLYGAEIFTDASTSIHTIGHRQAGLEKRGYLITPRIFSSRTKESWSKLITFIREFRNSDEEIIIKYRDKIENEFPLNASITWDTTTTFTTTTDISDAKVGNEVEFLNGFNGGTTAHITDISEDGGTYTVTIDETVTGATGTGLARIMNYKKMNTIDTEGIQNKDFAIPSKSEWIQFKIEIRSTANSYNSPLLERLQILNKTGQNS